MNIEFWDYPDIVCKTELYFVDSRNNIKYCKKCYNSINCAFSKCLLKKESNHTSININCVSYLEQEILIKKCDICKVRDLVDISFSNEIIDQRCDECRDFSGDQDMLIQEAIVLNLVPLHVKLIGDLKNFKKALENNK